MGSPLLGSIIIFSGNFAPRGYAYCNGQMLSITQNTALFSIVGTTYGGNGQTTFALPNLQGRVPVHQGVLAGGGTYQPGQAAGSENVTLTTSQMPIHTHIFTNTSSITAIQVKGTDTAPSTGGLLARAFDANGVASTQIYVPSGTAGTQVALGGVNVAGTNATAGGSQPHSNLQPYLTLTFCIATQGIFPSRN